MNPNIGKEQANQWSDHELLIVAMFHPCVAKTHAALRVAGYDRTVAAVRTKRDEMTAELKAKRTHADSDNQCTYCGREGHRASHCPVREQEQREKGECDA